MTGGSQPEVSTLLGAQSYEAYRNSATHFELKLNA